MTLKREGRAGGGAPREANRRKEAKGECVVRPEGWRQSTSRRPERRRGVRQGAGHQVQGRTETAEESHLRTPKGLAGAAAG